MLEKVRPETKSKTLEIPRPSGEWEMCLEPMRNLNGAQYVKTDLEREKVLAFDHNDPLGPSNMTEPSFLLSWGGNGLSSLREPRG